MGRSCLDCTRARRAGRTSGRRRRAGWERLRGHGSPRHKTAVAVGEQQTSWFERHGSTPITEIPGHWPEWYRKTVERRIELIETDANIALIERPEYKRRWNREPWEKQVERALRGWLLDRLESA